MGNSLNKKMLLCETQGLFGLNIGNFPRLLIVASYPCRICTLPHLLIVASMLHLKRSLISSVLQLKRLAWVQWLTLKQCNSQLVTFLQIRDILIGLQAQSQSNFFIIATSIIVFIIIVINCHLAFKLDHQVLQTVQQLVILKFPQLSSI